MENWQDYIENNRLQIIVKPNSSRTEIICFDADSGGLRVNVAAPADKNKANIEIIKFFTRLSKKKVFIKSGAISKKKLLFFH